MIFVLFYCFDIFDYCIIENGITVNINAAEDEGIKGTFLYEKNKSLYFRMYDFFD